MNRLKELRTQKGLRQQDLANYLSIAKSTYSYWESGKIEINNENLFRLSDYYEVSIDYLLGRTDEPMKIKKAAPENGDGQEHYVARNARLQELFDAIDTMDHTQLDALETIIEQVQKLGGWSKDTPSDDHQT